MKFEYTEPKVVKTEIVGDKERTIYEATFSVPMRVFYEIKTGADKATKEAVKPLITSSIKESFDAAGKDLVKYMVDYNKRNENK